MVRALDASRGWVNTPLAKGCKTMWTGIFDRIPALYMVVPPYYNWDGQKLERIRPRFVCH
jgi:hypothetical protein